MLLIFASKLELNHVLPALTAIMRSPIFNVHDIRSSVSINLTHRCFFEIGHLGCFDEVCDLTRSWLHALTLS